MVTLEGFKQTGASVLTPELATSIGAHIPERIQLRPTWRLKYSLEQHGASLKTLYERAQPEHSDHQQHGYVLAIRDARNGVFGAYVNEPLRPSEGRYHGNSDCLLWKALSHEDIAVYGYTGVNDFMIFCTPHFISFGGGDGHYGLWVDDGLVKGVTYPSATYNNPELSAQGSKFSVIALEVWEI